MSRSNRKLRIGVLGCGPIAQTAHFDACRKARNAELYAICDVADDLRARMQAAHEPQVAYADVDAMLGDPRVDAVIVAVSDPFHVPLCLRAIDAGKHVFVEKPLGVTVQECEELGARVAASETVLQVGNNRRFDPGVTFAHDFIREELGQRIAVKAWYYDSTVRYTMTDNLQPIPLKSAAARRPAGDPKADRRRYFMLAHGSHLVDTCRFLGGEMVRVRARLLERADSYAWFADVEFADGALGHLDLIIPVRGDFEEGFSVYGEHGNVQGRLPLTWYHKAGDVQCYSVRDGLTRRPLGEDAYSYRRQIEGFADTILENAPQHGATVEDGIAAMRAMVAIARSVETNDSVRLADVEGGV